VSKTWLAIGVVTFSFLVGCAAKAEVTKEEEANLIQQEQAHQGSAPELEGN
jgi:hypothetical protein